MKLYEILTLVAIFLGPIIAVVITLVVESKKRKRENQVQVMRMLLHTRSMVSDPNYNMAINLVPTEFNDCKDVMDAWREYIKIVNSVPLPETQAQHHQDMVIKQTILIYKIMSYLGFNFSEKDIGVGAYASDGFVRRDHLYLDSLVALREIANVLKQ